MRTLIAATCLLGVLRAESTQPTPPPAPVRNTFLEAAGRPDARIRVDADYLYWWTKNSDLPVAVVTTGSVDDPYPGVLGQPGTIVEFGQESIHNGGLSGFRIAVLGQLDEKNRYAVEGSGFYLPGKKSTVFSQQSSEVLGVPFNDTAPFPLPTGHGGWYTTGPGETALLLGFEPLGFTGAVTATSFTELWGVELNGLFRFLDIPTFRLSALGGVSYTDLFESLKFKFYNIGTPEQSLLSANLKDDFTTHNEIYTGQIGICGDWSRGLLFASFLAKVGFGGNAQAAHISGSFSDPIPNLYYSYGVGNTGGIFAQPTNSGKHTQGRFIVVPAATVKFGVNLLRYLRISFGYDIVFLSNVLRPGNQIDRNINETQAGASGGAPAVLTGPAQPKALMHTSNYWAQGINAGIEVQF